MSLLAALAATQAVGADKPSTPARTTTQPTPPAAAKSAAPRAEPTSFELAVRGAGGELRVYQFNRRDRTVKLARTLSKTEADNKMAQYAVYTTTPPWVKTPSVAPNTKPPGPPLPPGGTGGDSWRPPELDFKEANAGVSKVEAAKYQHTPQQYYYDAGQFRP